MKDMLPRLIRLKHAQKKVSAKVEVLVKLPNKDKYLQNKLNLLRARLVEYETSITNLETHGWERPPSSNPVSVDINVPITKRGG